MSSALLRSQVNPGGFVAEILWRTEYRDGVRWLFCNLAEIGFRLDDDGQASGMYLAVAAPLGGVASMGNILAKGDRGFSPSIEISSFTELDADDPTPASVNLNLLAEATDVSGPVYGLDIVLHRGVQGESGSAVISPEDYGDPTLGYIPAVAAGLETFELVPQKVPTMHWPASVDNVPSGTTAGFTMTTIPIAAAPYDRYVIPSGEVQVVAAGGATNLRVDLVAHLDEETGTKIVGRSYGVAGTKDKLSMIGYPPAGTTSSATKILAGQPANVYFRTEKQAGSSAYSSVAGTGLFGALTIPA
ncbi:hypothetical protein [Mycolicibacterium canariasense]|uniref:hypothetical protein n=1 Tax=Mycolicibacterium canariasense TaxID=228230 RepID=UPI0010422611|nr:hypothetical protein [Mycolicibacterium canariasense]